VINIPSLHMPVCALLLMYVSVDVHLSYHLICFVFNLTAHG